MINRAVWARLDKNHPATWIATWFGTGLLKPAPGTWGTLGGLPFGLALLWLGGIPTLLAGIIIVTALGWWATGKVEAMTGDHDGGYIVVDEVAGVWITLLATPLAPLPILLAFVLFRAFDILKPWPCNYLDQKLTGPASVMLDDLAAGGYAALVMLLLSYVGIGY